MWINHLRIYLKVSQNPQCCWRRWCLILLHSVCQLPGGWTVLVRTFIFQFLQFSLVGTSSFLFHNFSRFRINEHIFRPGWRSMQGREVNREPLENKSTSLFLSLSPSFRLENESVSMSFLCPGLCLCGKWFHFYSSVSKSFTIFTWSWLFFDRNALLQPCCH